jgi:hypothetical protein
VQVEQEEEFLTNTLQKKLEKVISRHLVLLTRMQQQQQHAETVAVPVAAIKLLPVTCFQFASAALQHHTMLLDQTPVSM